MRSNFSLLDGASHTAELVSTAAAFGYAGLGICDTNSLAGVRPLIQEEPVSLPAAAEGEEVGRDYARTALTLRQHPMALLRPQLSLTRCDDSRTLARARSRQRVRIPGLVLMRQRPMTAKGVIFVTIEDEHGHANVVVYAYVAERDRAALLGGRLLVVEGRVERQDEHSEVPIIHLIARRLIDRSDMLDMLAHIDGKEDGAWAENTLGRADEVKRPDPWSHQVKMPPTRDIR